MTTIQEQQTQARAREAREAREAHHDEAHDRRSLSHLLRELRDEAVTLVQKEMQLARTEVSEKITQAQHALAASAAGAGLLLAGVVTLCLAASAGLYAGLRALEIAPIVAGWLAPLCIGLLVTIIGLALGAQARKVTDADRWRPERTERSLRETRDWAERKM